MGLRSSLALLLITVPLPGCQAPASSTSYLKPGRYEERLTLNGETRTYILRVPRTFDGKSPLPVVFALHGWTLSGAIAERAMGLGEAAEKYGFVLVAPDGLGDPRGWNAGFIDLGGKKADDVGFLANVLDRLPTELPIDKKRIYFVGHSNGAMLAHYAGAKLSDRVAAIVGVAGTIGLPNAEVTTPSPRSPVSALIVHGKKDEWVAYATGGPGLLKGIGARDTALWWATQDRTPPVPDAASFEDGPLERWKDPASGTEVELLTLDQAGHAWPTVIHPKGQPAVSFADFIWDFCRRHPKP